MPLRIIERSANVRKAVRDVVTGKTFDNGVLCSSENSVVVDEPIVDEVQAASSCAGRVLPVEGRDGGGRKRAGHTAAASQSSARRQAGHGYR